MFVRSVVMNLFSFLILTISVFFHYFFLSSSVLLGCSWILLFFPKFNFWLLDILYCAFILNFISISSISRLLDLLLDFIWLFSFFILFILFILFALLTMCQVLCIYFVYFKKFPQLYWDMTHICNFVSLRCDALIPTSIVN